VCIQKCSRIYGEVVPEKGEDGPSERQKCGSKLTNVGNIDCGCVRNENEKGGKN
jgi:hypothetical protein